MQTSGTFPKLNEKQPPRKRPSLSSFAPNRTVSANAASFPEPRKNMSTHERREEAHRKARESR